MVVNSACYACKCLNVRILSHSTSSTQNQSTDKDSAWVGVNVDDDSIKINHSEITLRTRSKASPDPQDASKYNLHVSLSCMNCQSVVYRVVRATSPDAEGKEGPILPTEEWVEKDILKTLTGRIEVHKDCLTREAIAQAESHPSYSKTFRVVLPTTSQSPPSTYSEPVNTPEPRQHLPTLNALFLPPPFTPSHPAFAHIASVANAESEKIRATAEAHVASVVQEQLCHIQEQEKQIHRQAELLWLKFRESLDHIEVEKRDVPASKKRDSGNWATSPRATSPPAEYSDTVSIHDFVPTPAVAPSRISPGSYTPRASALSASIATSSFHHPRAKAASPTGSPSTASSKTLGGLPGSADAEERNDILEPFRRDLRDGKDVATSLLVLDLEAQMERRRQKRSAEAETTKEASAAQTAPPATNGVDKPLTPPASKARESTTASNTTPESKKGKRKVTFDIQPDVVTIKRDVTKENDEAIRQSASAAKGNEVSVFDLEDELEDEMDDGSPSESQPTLPLLDLQASQTPRRQPNRMRQSSVGGVGLPQSLSSLRPISLPVPTAGPSILSPQTETQERSPRKAATSHLSHLSPEPQGFAENESPTHTAEFMELVAANTPSHRGAWKKDSKSWRLFMEKQSDGVNAEDDDGLEENEGIPIDDWDDQYGWNSYKPEGLAHSLPVTIGSPLGQKSFGFQMKTSLSDRPGLLVPGVPAGDRSSSEASKKAAYAERYRGREIDPGAMDFDSPPVDEDDDEGDDIAGEMTEGRGRQRALRILQARSELPEAGMWRSLA